MLVSVTVHYFYEYFETEICSRWSMFVESNSSHSIKTRKKDYFTMFIFVVYSFRPNHVIMEILIHNLESFIHLHSLFSFLINVTHKILRYSCLSIELIINITLFLFSLLYNFFYNYKICQ
jgi:hypothetical protein